MIVSAIMVVLLAPCFAQDFDDLPFSSPDPMTYFQQEMTSLMRFQVKNDINIPFFISLSIEEYGNNYNEDKMESIFPDYNSWGHGSSGVIGSSHQFKAHTRSEGYLIGFQFKINPSFYIPLFLFIGQANLGNYADEGLYVGGWKTQFFPGTGLFINTDTFKGGVYLGIGRKNEAYGDRKFLLDHENNSNVSETDSITPKIAFLPIVNTSNWNYVGKALDKIMGFIGWGDVVYTSKEEGESKLGLLISTLNLLLDFSFNKIDFDFITLDPRAYYQRDNYDVFAKANTYGFELRGGFLKIPLTPGFIVNGGYKHFYTYHPDIASVYHDTGFFNGSIYVNLGGYAVFGFTYRYDDVTNHQKI